MANIFSFHKTDSMKTGLLLTFYLLLTATHCKLISIKDGDNSNNNNINNKDDSQIPPEHKAILVTTLPESSPSSLNSMRLAKQNDEEQVASRSSSSIMGVAAALTSSGTNGDPSYCNSTKRDTCWEKLPTSPGMGIPASKEEVDAACKAFNTGMDCFDQWVKECLKTKVQRDKAREFVIGAHETFTFLCRDEKFRNEYLRHSNCLRKISPYYDGCSKSLVTDIKRTMAKNKDSALNLCCIRLRFLQCVTDVANKHCSMVAANFVQRMAETLVRTEMKHHIPKECLTVTTANCSAAASSPGLSHHHFSNNHFLTMLKPSFLHHLNFLLPTFTVLIVVTLIWNISSCHQ